MKFLAVVCLLTIPFASTLAAQALEPGSGAPTDAVRQQFERAYARGTFATFAALPPATAVRRYGTTGLIQEFNDSTKSGGRLALIKATTTADLDSPSADVFQVWTDLFAHFSTVGVATAGYPVMDTQFCPGNPCSWGLFDRRHALFAWSSGANEPQNITVRDPFFTRWDSVGGMNRMGPPTTAETSVTGSRGGNATMQVFRLGVLYNITSGSLAGRVVGVREPIYSMYLARGTHTGMLGFPVSDEQGLPNGRKRQTFEGGSIEYAEGEQPVLRPPVASVNVVPSSSPVRLQAGETVRLQATVAGADGVVLTDRAVAWASSNSRTAAIDPIGAAAVIRAVGAGTARITASSEGRVSLAVEVIVTARCCAPGEGAPTSSIEQAFIDALVRARLVIQNPGPDRVRRISGGYIQELQGQDSAATRYLLLISDRSSQAHVVSGAILSRYEESGGPAGFLGFPVSDANPTGRQMFEGGALAGNPVHAVTGQILARWSSGGYEIGAVGAPIEGASRTTSFTGSSGLTQRFRSGTIAGVAGGAYLIPGILEHAWHQAGAATGKLGWPIGEVTGNRQAFEGGVLEQLPGSTDVRLEARPRQPAAAVSPENVIIGGRVQVTLSGFAEDSLLNVTITGQAPFVAPAPNGAFTWETVIPSGTPPGPLTVRAHDPVTGQVAQAAINVRTITQARLTLTIRSGDTQSGVPGQVLPQPLRVLLRDSEGNPMRGVPVQWAASPRARVTPETSVTSADGIAQTRLALPPQDGVAVVTAESAGQVVTFSARSAGSAIGGFPGLKADSAGDGLVPALASMLRYYQTRGTLATPNGLADVASLSEFLRKSCFPNRDGSDVCDGFDRASLNPARVGNFVDGAVFVEPIEDLAATVAAGDPVLVSLRLAEGTLAHVVAIGIAAGGEILIHDPSPAGRTRLSEYERSNGVRAGTARLRSLREAGRAFAVIGTEQLRLTGPSGTCGVPYRLPDGRDYRVCSTDETEYQLEPMGLPARITDLASGFVSILIGSQLSAFAIRRDSGGLLSVTPQAPRLATRQPVVNSATFTPEIAVGGLITIFGSGLWRSGHPESITVSIGGQNARVTFGSPGQLNVEVPPDLPSGSHMSRVDTPGGSVETTVEIRESAPAVFAIVNQDGSVNGPEKPARRGEAVVLYATGLGAVNPNGSLRSVMLPVGASARGRAVRVLYAGLVPGYSGLYQVNLLLPADLAPGIEVPVEIRQGAASRAEVTVAIW